MALNRNSKIIIFGCVAAIVVVGGLTFTSMKKRSNFKMKMMGEQLTEVSVKTQKAEIQTLQNYVVTNGEIEAQSSIQVYPEIGGKVSKVYVSLGQYVKKGEKLAEVDPSSPGIQYTASPVYAPISGTITQSVLEVGTKVSTTSAITVIGDVRNLQITAKIPERYVASLKNGLKAKITVEAYPNEEFSATVTKVSPVVDSTSRTKEIILNFDKTDSRINAGMFAKVILLTDKFSGEIVVPAGCIIQKTDNQIVYILDKNEDGKDISVSKVVTTGKTVDNQTQILSGLNVGDIVVVEGMKTLSNRALVKDITNGITYEEVPAVEVTVENPENPESNSDKNVLKDTTEKVKKSLKKNVKLPKTETKKQKASKNGETLPEVPVEQGSENIEKSEN